MAIDMAEPMHSADDAVPTVSSNAPDTGKRRWFRANGDVHDLPADLAIRATDVEITYKVFADAEGRRSFRSVFGNGFRARETRDVNAVRGVSFDVPKGQAVGLIGRNGAGKSTLLRSVAQVLPVTGGELLTSGQVSLLGVGAALRPSLSGRRNIYLGCLALGMRLPEVDEVLPEIVDFCELGEALDRPIKTYSSGMRSRIHFAIATAQIPDILLIDEALSVGDRVFAKKSREKIQQVVGQAGTVMVVSHSLPSVKKLCDRTIWMHQGEIVDDGPSAKIIEKYTKDE